MTTQPTSDSLLPCMFCDSSDIRLFKSDGKEYAQCMTCTACGPDHINDRHWNKRAWRIPAAAWLRARAARQEKTNEECPAHAAAYKTWRDAPLQLRMYANEVESGQ
jgi:hypothetical protein